jgi:hypothetical protein
MSENTSNTVSPYRAAQIINLLLVQDEVTDAMGEPKQIAPQMLYGYVKKGTIAHETTSTGKKVIAMDVLAEFYENYKAGQVGRGGGASVDTLASEVRDLLNK